MTLNDIAESVRVLRDELASKRRQADQEIRRIAQEIASREARRTALQVANEECTKEIDKLRRALAILTGDSHVQLVEADEGGLR